MLKLLTGSIILLSFPLSHSQQTLYLTDVSGYSSLAQYTFTAISNAFESLTGNCNAGLQPTAYASCACLKNQNSASILQRIVIEAKRTCGSLKTDDITSATQVWSTYCAPAIPASTAATCRQP